MKFLRSDDRNNSTDEMVLAMANSMKIALYVRENLKPMTFTCIDLKTSSNSDAESTTSNN